MILRVFVSSWQCQVSSISLRLRASAGDNCTTGFTLLEILISTLILSIVLSALYASYSSNLSAIQIARNAGQSNQTARVVLERMRQDLESAFITVAHTDSGVLQFGMQLQHQRIEDREADRLDFTALSHLSFSPDTSQIDLCEVGYFLEPDGEGDGLVLYRRDDWSPDSDFKEGGDRLELARRVAGLEVLFEDEQGLEHDTWSSGTDGELPTLIRIKLRLAEPDGQERVFSTSVHPALAPRRKE
jgi:prepilin-type N-terminal cleavage/methylation domain-containing protein